MLTSLRLAVAFVLVISVCGIAWAQTVSDVPSSTSVTAAATEQGMRFMATADVVEMRLEVFSSIGEKIFDTRFRKGNVLDWMIAGKAQLQQAAQLPDDSYLCVVTVRTLSGHLRQQQGLVTWQSGRASVQRIKRQELSAPQSQAWELSRATEALPPLIKEADAGSFNVLPAQAAPSVTVTVHDAQTGQVTSTAGALTFRTGDVFAAREVERMRITEDGKVGIGTDHPKATLDVAGTVRVSEGFRFPDGTTLTANNGRLMMRDANGESIPTANAAGTGTQNQIAKWTETGGAGTLGDSAITEVNGNVGIGLTNPAARLHIFGSSETVRQTLSSTSSFIQFGFYEGAVKKGAFGFQGSTSSGFIGGPGAMVFGTLAASPVAFFTSGTERVRLDNNGNVGIGTTTPTSKLHVVGNGLFTGNLTVNGTVSLPADSITDAMVSNTLTASDLAGGSSVVSNAEVDDNLTINGGTINNSVIGGTTPAAGTFTTLTAGNVTFNGLRTEGGSIPNVIGGHANNSVTAGVVGATIGGGGTTSGFHNRVTDTNGTVGGGVNNRAGDDTGTTVDKAAATVSGGSSNIASGAGSAVPGGVLNTAEGDYSFAAGRRAKALNQGSFAWADSTDADFPSSANNQFLIRAGGGVGINTNDPKATLGLVGTAGNHANFFMRAPGETKGVNLAVGFTSFGEDAPFFIAHYDGTTYLDRLVVNSDGTVSVTTLAAPTAAHLCVNGTKLAFCSSSLRYKEDVVPFSAGLNLLNRLRPVTFKWKERDERDAGLIAEEVAQVEPLFVTRNAAGEIEGVKYDQLSVVLINAVKEQQTQIEQQREQLKQQQSLIDGLKKLVCRNHPNADVCK